MPLDGTRAPGQSEPSLDCIPVLAQAGGECVQLGNLGRLDRLDPGTELPAAPFAEQPREALGKLGGGGDDRTARADGLEAVAVVRVQPIGATQDPLTNLLGRELLRPLAFDGTVREPVEVTANGA